MAKRPGSPPIQKATRRQVLTAATSGLAAAAFPFSKVTAASSDAPAKLLRGLALAGAEFGQLVPGQFGRDYIYPTPDDFKYCANLGFNVVRLPFKWDRLQPDLNKPFDEEEWGHLSGALQNAKDARLSVILDPHNYAHRRVRDDDYTVDHLIGSKRVPTAAFTSFWQDLAQRTKNEPHVIFGMMNEPADIAPDVWLEIANQTLAAIRASGASQLVLVPGVAYTGAHSWYAAGNTAMNALHDPGNNFAIEVHQYLDSDSSGRSGQSVSETIGRERLQDFQTWARDNKLQAFLGEFGCGRDAKSLKALNAMVREVESKPDVWIGWTAWAAGPWWPDDDPLRLSKNSKGEVPPQTKLLSGFARSKS
jgi:endoglucanase